MSPVHGLLLAAGAGRRAGGPKALRAGPDGRPGVRRAAEVLLDGGCDRVGVVVGAGSEQVLPLLVDPAWPAAARVTPVPCPGWADGMGASLRAGLAAVPDGVAVLVHLVDLPDVGPDVVARLLARVQAGPDVLARATYAGAPGHPVLIGPAHRAGVAASGTGDRGARDHLARHHVETIECGDLATGLDEDGPRG